MNETGQILSDKQRKTIPILLSVLNIEKACSKAGISKSTYYSWLSQKPFSEELKKQQNIIVDSAINKLRGCFALAVEELVNLLKSKKESIRLRTVEKIIEFNLSIEELKSIQERLSRLEELNEEKRYRKEA
jgi:ACT domain-containing protein